MPNLVGIHPEIWPPNPIVFVVGSQNGGGDGEGDEEKAADDDDEDEHGGVLRTRKET